MTSKGEKTPSPRLKKSGTVYWMRFGLAISSAVLCAFLRLKAEGIAVGAVIYLISYFLVRDVVNPEINLGRYEIYLTGLGTYFATWITFWILLHTLLEAI